MAFSEKCLIFADGKTNLFQYDPLNRITRDVDEHGNETIYTYDATGRPLTKKDPLGGWGWKWWWRRLLRWDLHGSILLVRCLFSSLGGANDDSSWFATRSGRELHAFCKHILCLSTNASQNVEYESLGRRYVAPPTDVLAACQPPIPPSKQPTPTGSITEDRTGIITEDRSSLKGSLPQGLESTERLDHVGPSLRRRTSSLPASHRSHHQNNPRQLAG